MGLGAQAGEARLRSVVTGAGFKRFRRAMHSPVNLVLEASLTLAQATAIGFDRKCGLGLAASLSCAQPGRYFATAISSSAAPSFGNSAATDSSITVKRGRPFGNLARLVNTMRPSTGVSVAMRLHARDAVVEAGLRIHEGGAARRRS